MNKGLEFDNGKLYVLSDTDGIKNMEYCDNAIEILECENDIEFLEVEKKNVLDKIEKYKKYLKTQKKRNNCFSTYWNGIIGYLSCANWAT